MRNTLLKIAASFVLACVATSAFAHAQLESSSPPVGGTVTSPNAIRLTFSEGVEPKFSGVALTAGGGGAAALGAATVEPGHQNVLIVPVTKPLAPGPYTVTWHAVSVDSHHTQGTFAFTVK